MSSGILVPPPGIKPAPSVLEVGSFNRSATKEALCLFLTASFRGYSTLYVWKLFLFIYFVFLSKLDLLFFFNMFPSLGQIPS